MEISVIIPCYNYGRYLFTSISSVIQQSVQAQEILIVDDGSTDETREIVTKLQQQHPNETIRYLYQENKGVSAARNYGYKNTTGQYLMFLDADDKLLPNALKEFSLASKNHKEIDMFFGGYRGIKYSGTIYERIPAKLDADAFKNIEDILLGKMQGIRLSTTMLKRTVMQNLQFDEKVHNEEDALFYAHVFHQFNCMSLQKTIAEMPRHDDSLRENYTRILETDTYGIENLFDSFTQTSRTKKIKKLVYLRRYLKIARKACIAKNYYQGAKYYQKAFKLSPKAVINLKHLPRMIKCLLLQHGLNQ